MLTCATCAHWKALPGSAANAGQPGQCRRHPPRIVDKALVFNDFGETHSFLEATQFPLTRAIAGCGEHAPAATSSGEG